MTMVRGRPDAQPQPGPKPVGLLRPILVMLAVIAIVAAIVLVIEANGTHHVRSAPAPTVQATASAVWQCARQDCAGE